MMKIQFEQPGCRVYESALYQTTATVITTDDLVLVVDPNWLPAEVLAIRDYVEAIRGDRPLYLLFTHSDYDHIIGYAAFQGAKTIASQAFVANLEKEKAVDQIRAFDEEYYVNRPYPVVYPPIDVVINADHQTLEVGRTRLIFFLAPGHNADGIFTFVEPAGIWLAGDYLCEVEFPFLYHGRSAYLATLTKADQLIASYSPRLLIPGHGKITTVREEMRHRVRTARQYIEELTEAIRSRRDFPVDQWMARYHFPRGMEKAHRDNVALIRRELGLEG